MQVRLVVKCYKKKKKAEDTRLVKRAGNQSSHEGPKVSVRGYSIEPHVRRKADITSHKNFIAQGFRLFKEKEES